MADDNSQRPFRNADFQSRATPTAGNSSSGGNDPLAELARLIGQSDPFGEFGRDNARQPAAPHAEPMVRGLAAQGTAREPYPGQAPSVPQSVDNLSRQPYGSPPLTDGDDVYQMQGPVPGYEDQAAAGAYQGAGYDPNMPLYSGEDQHFYDDVPPPRRRMGVLAIAAVFALAVIGTAGAFGYRALFGSVSSSPPPVIKADSKPVKIVPENAKDQSAKLINDRVNDRGGDQKLVSRQEQPVDLNQDKPAGVLGQDHSMAGAGNTQTPALGSGVIGNDPKKIRTITIRPDGSGTPEVASATPTPARANAADAMPANEPAAPPTAPASLAPPAESAAPAAMPEPAPRRTVTHRAAPAAQQRVAAASSNAPLSLTPDSVGSMRTASTAAPRPARAPTRLAPSSAAGGGYAVQVSSRRSQADAQAALNRMQSRYASVIGGQHVMVKRVDLGAKGVYYRAMVGPFGSSEEASKLCSRLKAAGGSCFVQRI